MESRKGFSDLPTDQLNYCFNRSIARLIISLWNGLSPSIQMGNGNLVGGGRSRSYSHTHTRTHSHWNFELSHVFHYMTIYVVGP